MTIEDLNKIDADVGAEYRQTERIRPAAWNYLVGMFRRHLSAPQWARQPPTKAGWYWARPVRASGPANNLPPRVPQPVEVLGEAGHLTVYVTGWDCEESLRDFDLWLGPIEAPPIPEGT